MKSKRQRLLPDTAIMDVPPDRAELPVSCREYIEERIAMFVRAGVIEDTGERRPNRLGQLEPVYRAVRKRRQS
jgi:hypothetical protein